MNKVLLYGTRVALVNVFKNTYFASNQRPKTSDIGFVGVVVNNMIVDSKTGKVEYDIAPGSEVQVSESVMYIVLGPTGKEFQCLDCELEVV